MRKMVLRTAAAAAVLTAAMGFTAFAGQWEQNETGWWWQNDGRKLSGVLLAVAGRQSGRPGGVLLF